MDALATTTAPPEIRTALDAETSVLLPGQTPAGAYILSVLFKRSYDIIPGESCRRAAIDAPLHPGDVHFDGPMNSALRFESDFVPFKIAADVVVNGKAYAPGKVPTEELTASLIIGSHQKDLYIVGNRTCYFRAFNDPGFNAPEPFIEMEIRYERAYGGIDIQSNPSLPYPYPRNHLGRGFVVKNKKRSIEGLLLPNIEDPSDILHPANLCCNDMKFWERMPMPQGFGWFSKAWHPRVSYAGVLPADRAVEQELRRAYSLVIPEEQRALYEKTTLPSMDFRGFNGASAGLAMPFLRGDEQIRMVNLSPEGSLKCNLPGDQPTLSIDLGFGEQHPELFLQTVFIEMEGRRVDLVWRGAVPYPGPDWLPSMKKKEIIIR